MKYSASIEIDLPLERVIELVMDESLIKQWQKECVSRTLLQGEYGQVGAKTEVVAMMNDRKITMIETITGVDLPNGFSETYEADGIWNSITHHFEAINDAKMRWTAEAEFTCSKFMMKVMMFLMPGALKKETEKFLNNFKAWAESYEA